LLVAEYAVQHGIGLKVMFDGRRKFWAAALLTIPKSTEQDISDSFGRHVHDLGDSILHNIALSGLANGWINGRGPAHMRGTFPIPSQISLL
jgi:hypothetical protein